MPKIARDFFAELELSRVEMIGGEAFPGAKSNLSIFLNYFLRSVVLLLKTNHEVFTHYLITFSKMNPNKILKKLRFGMRRNILSILILLAAQISITQPFKAAEINCKSPVHKNKPKCKGEPGKSKKEETILDPETG